MVSRSEKAVKYFGDIRYPKIEKIILEWAAKQPDPYITLVNYLQTGKQEPIKSKIITPRRLDSCGIYWEFGRAMTELNIEDVGKIARGMGYGPSYLKIMLNTYKNFPNGVPMEIKNVADLKEAIKNAVKDQSKDQPNGDNDTASKNQQNSIGRSAKIFSYFRNITFPKVKESVMEWAAEQPDPYVALINYLIIGEQKPVKTEKIILRRNDTCGIYWEFGRAMEETKCVIARVAKAAGCAPTYMRYMHHVYSKFPEGVPEDIRSTTELRETMSFMTKKDSLKKDSKKDKQQQDNIEATAQQNNVHQQQAGEATYKENIVDAALKELSDYALQKGKPVPNAIIDETAVKYGISPNGLKNYWGAYCRNTIHPTVQVIIEMMAEKIASYEAKIKEMQAANEEYKNKIQELQTVNLELENKVKELQANKTALEGKISQDEQKLNEYKEKIKAFMLMFNNLKEQFSVAV